MAREKRSFFERLTGSISVADEEAEMVAEETPTGDWVEEEVEEGQLGVDVYQTPTEIIIQAMVAGVKPEDLSVTIGREMVTIKGSRAKITNVAEDNYFSRELYWGAFSRTILLPNEVEAEEAEATERYGLLTIRLPKIDKERIQKLKVKST